MVKIMTVFPIENYVLIEFMAHNLLFSTRVYNTEALTPNEIIAKGFLELKPHISMECERLGHEFDCETPKFDSVDEIVQIELNQKNHVLVYRKGQEPFTFEIKCYGITMFNKRIDITDEATFTPSNIIVVDGTAESIVVKIQYETFHTQLEYKITIVEDDTNPINDNISTKTELKPEVFAEIEDLQDMVQNLKDLYLDIVACALGVVSKREDKIRLYKQLIQQNKITIDEVPVEYLVDVEVVMQE